MAAAQAGLPRPTEPVAALWHDCTVLREHRGDGHLAAVALCGLVWPEPHLLPGRQVDPQQQQYRGWDDVSWQRAAERVRGRDTVELEAVTDQLAAPRTRSSRTPSRSSWLAAWSRWRMPQARSSPTRTPWVSCL